AHVNGRQEENRFGSTECSASMSSLTPVARPGDDLINRQEIYRKPKIREGCRVGLPALHGSEADQLDNRPRHGGIASALGSAGGGLMLAMFLAPVPVAAQTVCSPANGATAGTRGTACGQGATSGQEGTAYGADAKAAGTGGTAVGEFAAASGTQGTAIGSGGTTASGAQSTAVGVGARATNTASAAMGSNALASGANASAMGVNSVAAGGSSVALGRSSVANGNNSVALGASSTDGGVANVVSVGSDTNKRRIVNVAGGNLIDGGTDAVNGGQLFVTNTNVATAQSTANDGVARANAARDLAGLARTEAAAAQSTANDGVSRANAARDLASTARMEAATAQSTAIDGVS
ncbi:MAG: hypothetical protein EOP67_72570, partial [Sphingomonas sp.]